MEYLMYLSFGDQGWGDELLKGLAITLGLALCALPVGMVIGTGVAALSVSIMINKTLKWIDPSNGFFELNPFGAGVIALGLVFSSYAAEVR